MRGPGQSVKILEFGSVILRKHGRWFPMDLRGSLSDSCGIDGSPNFRFKPAVKEVQYQRGRWLKKEEMVCVHRRVVGVTKHGLASLLVVCQKRGRVPLCQVVATSIVYFAVRSSCSSKSSSLWSWTPKFAFTLLLILHFHPAHNGKYA